MPRMLRVNMTDLSVKVEEVPEAYATLGGRSLTSRLIADEVEPTCHPLGPSNKLVIAPGVVSGTSAPSSGRISVGGKSPLTGGIKESNAGTPVAQQLGRMGYKAIVVEGQPQDDGQWFALEVDMQGGALVPVNGYEGMGLDEAFKKAFADRGSDKGLIANGPAGEKRMASAGVCFNDKEGRASRYAGRGGLGAVMGSKRLKFVIVDATGAPGVALHDEERFKSGQRKLIEGLRNHDVTKPGGALSSYGTSVLINILNEVGGLPTRNFSAGRFEGASNTSGETLAETVKRRGGAGTMGHACHPGCVIRCSNVYAREDGTEQASAIEYESNWALGANLGIDDLDKIAEMIRLCNAFGIDTIETGVTLGVAMEAGLAEFGDGDGAIRLIEEIGAATPLGRILGQGADFTGRAYGVTRVPVAKRQGMPAYEPRAVKGIGITYMTSPMGADHTAGYTIAPEILAVGGKADPLDTDGKAEMSRAFQATTAFVDSSGYCLFTTFALLDFPEAMAGMVDTVNGVLGTEWTADDLVSLGMETLSLERAFNERAGLTSAHDRPPEFMRHEKLPPHNGVFDVTDQELDSVFAR